MLHPQHNILTAYHSQDHARRVMGWALVAALHAAVIIALINAFVVARVWQPPPGPLVLVPQTVVHPKPTTLPPAVKRLSPADPVIDAVPPIITIQTDDNNKSLPPKPGPTDPGVPDSAAQGIAASHTIPAYPPLAQRLGEQGTVQLRLAVSQSGAVTAAQVTRSSGFADLDQCAVDWVIAHWKYRPAVKDGAPVAGLVNAAVAFNLKNAR